MSELQTAEIESEVLEETQTGTVESGAELATDSGENREEKDQATIAQEKAQTAINKQHAKYREEERQRIAVEKEAAELREKLKAFEASAPVPEIPPIPDPYDDDYESKVRARDEAIIAKTAYDAEQSAINARKETQAKESQANEQKRVDALIETYNAKISEIGLNVEDVHKAGQVLIDYGVSNDIAEFILQDAEGPLITAYLAANPLEVDEIRSMNSLQAAVKINSDIRSKASSLRPQTSNAPEPPVTLSGNGPGEKESPLLKGATFE